MHFKIGQSATEKYLDKDWVDSKVSIFLQTTQTGAIATNKFVHFITRFSSFSVHLVLEDRLFVGVIAYYYLVSKPQFLVFSCFGLKYLLRFWGNFDH